MALVKNMHEDRIVYYWCDDAGKRVSPLLANKALADEWRRQTMHENYAGKERRSSSLDRRLYQHKREQHQGNTKVSPLFSQGRRTTDKPVKVEHDLAKAKLEELFAQYPNSTAEADRTKARN